MKRGGKEVDLQGSRGPRLLWKEGGAAQSMGRNVGLGGGGGLGRGD